MDRRPLEIGQLNVIMGIFCQSNIEGNLGVGPKRRLPGPKIGPFGLKMAGKVGVFWSTKAFFGTRTWFSCPRSVPDWSPSTGLAEILRTHLHDMAPGCRRLGNDLAGNSLRHTRPIWILVVRIVTSYWDRPRALFLSKNQGRSPTVTFFFRPPTMTSCWPEAATVSPAKVNSRSSLACSHTQLVHVRPPIFSSTLPRPS